MMVVRNSLSLCRFIGCTADSMESISISTRRKVGLRSWRNSQQHKRNNSYWKQRRSGLLLLVRRKKKKHLTSRAKKPVRIGAQDGLVGAERSGSHTIFLWTQPNQ